MGIMRKLPPSSRKPARGVLQPDDFGTWKRANRIIALKRREVEGWPGRVEMA